MNVQRGNVGRRWLLSAVMVAVVALWLRPARAEVERVEVLDRALVAGGKVFGNVGRYERLRGRLYLSFEANAAENQAVSDIRLAPRDNQGRIHVTTDFLLLKPLDAGR